MPDPIINTLIMVVPPLISIGLYWLYQAHKRPREKPGKRYYWPIFRDKGNGLVSWLPGVGPSETMSGAWEKVRHLAEDNLTPDEQVGVFYGTRYELYAEAAKPWPKSKWEK